MMGNALGSHWTFKKIIKCRRCGRSLYASDSRIKLLCTDCEKDEKSLEKMARKMGLEGKPINTTDGNEKQALSWLPLLEGKESEL